MDLFKELNLYQSLINEIEAQRNLRDEFKVAKFLIGLHLKYENVHASILTSNEVSSLYEVYFRVQRIYVLTLYAC